MSFRSVIAFTSSFSAFNLFICGNDIVQQVRVMTMTCNIYIY